jgi:hypothetical protein
LAAVAVVVVAALAVRCSLFPAARVVEEEEEEDSLP